MIRLMINKNNYITCRLVGEDADNYFINQNEVVSNINVVGEKNELSSRDIKNLIEKFAKDNELLEESEVPNLDTLLLSYLDSRGSAYFKLPKIKYKDKIHR